MKRLVTGMLLALTALQVLADDVVYVSMAISPDGVTAVTGTGEGSLLIWNTTPTWSLRKRMDLGDQRLFGFDFSDDGRLLGFGTQDGNLVVMNVETGSVVFTVDDRSGSVSSVQFGADTSVFAAGQGDQISRYDWQTGELLSRYELGSTSEVEDFEVIENQGWLFIARFDEQARLMDIDSFSITQRYKQPASFGSRRLLFVVDYSSDDTQIVTGGINLPLVIWDRETGNPVQTIARIPEMTAP